MSRLYGSMDADASKTTATKRGHRSISAHVRGWDDGVRVVARIETPTDVDVFDVYRTAGSNGSHVDVWLGCVVNGRWVEASYPHDLERPADPQALTRDHSDACGFDARVGFEA